MSVKLILPAIAAAALTAGAAQAADWGEKIELCSAAADEQGLIEVEKYKAKFDGGTSRRIDIVFTPKEEGEKVSVKCKISRGVVKSVERKA